MKQPLNILRLFAEVLAAVAAAELAVLLLLPVVAPGVHGTLEALLDAGMLSILAGPVIVWRLVCAMRRAGTSQDAAKTAKPWRMIAGTAGVLVLGLAGTGVAVYKVRATGHAEAKAKFEQLSERLVGEARRRVEQPGRGLAGIKGTYAASRSVERGEFAACVATRDLSTEFPGALGFGFIQRVMRTDLDAFIAAERADDAPDFAVSSLATPGSPLAHAPDLYVIKHCFPRERNAPAWGLDIGSEPLRREAAEWAATTGQPAITGKITLVQDDTKQAGFLYLVPVYKNGTNPKTPEERLAALAGLVYAPILLAEAMVGVAGVTFGDLDFEIFDGAHTSTATQLYDDDKHLEGAEGTVYASRYAVRMFQRSAPLIIGGHTWTITTSTKPTFDAGIDRSLTAMLGVGGTMLSLLLAGIVWTLGSGRARAVRLAESMTADLSGSESRLRAMLEAEPECVKVLDAELRIIEMNPAGLATIAADTFDRVHGSSVLELVIPLHREEFAANMARVLGGERVESSFEIEGLDGQRHWMEQTAVLLPEAAGSGGGRQILAMARDITARKQSDVAMSHLSQMNNQMSDMAQMGSWEYEPASGSIFWTKQMYKLFELPETYTPTLDNTMSFFPEAARAKVEAQLKRAIETGEDIDYVVPFTTAKGRERWVRGMGKVERRADGTLRLFGALQDVTESQAATQALVESEARFRVLVEGADVVVWEFDWGAEVFTYVSPQAFNLGYPLGAWLIRGFWEEHIHPEDRERAVAFCRSEVQAGNDHRFQYRMITADGSVMWIDDMVTVVPREGQPPLLRGILVDITERMETQAALATAQALAESASKSKSAFLANMSHEIRTPLTAILGFTDLLREDGDIAVAPEQRIRSIDTIKNAGQHLLTVINDILDLSKIEADKMTVERIDTPLAGVLHEVESLMRPRATGKRLALSVTLATPVPEHILSDPTRLRQILMNLVGNAVKFTESGGVTITAGATELDGRPRLVIDIEDTGAGLTTEQAGRLFQAFGQADETMTRKFGGTGLGLTICRRLSALMGGDTKLLRTEPGKGSCFRLELPLEAVVGSAMISHLDVVAATSTTASTSAPVKLTGQILLAEDGLDNQRLIAFHLRKAGAQVTIADNGRIALEMIDKAAADGTPFDLLLTDMQMPEMDGYTLARTLRKRGSTLTIVALTAHAMAEDRDKCLAAGCDDYASKPIDKAKLLATCAAWLGARGGVKATKRAA